MNLLVLGAFRAYDLRADDSGLKAIFIYDPIIDSVSDNQQGKDSEINGYKRCNIWICIINQASLDVAFPTAINSHIIKAGTAVRLHIINTDNVIGLRGIKPASEMKIVDLRPGELCIFKYKYIVSLRVDHINTVPVELEVSKEIGQRYECWWGILSGKFQKATPNLHNEIMELVEKYQKVK